MPGAASLRDAIRAEALALGFDAVGFARAALAGQARRNLEAFVARGYHGDMGWLAKDSARRSEPDTLWPAARSVVVLALNYAPAGDPLALLENKTHGLVSAYARNRDYHDVMKRRLKRLAGWMHQVHGLGVKVFVDTAPVMEKPLAGAAGLGWQGKHTNLVSRRFGSWLFLGEVYLDADLPADPPQRDLCGRCRRCQDVCPTGAFPTPYRLDARRCISYLTIEHKGHIDRALRPLMGNRIYGCDDCLAVCPWNKFARATREAAFLPRVELAAPLLADLAALDDAGFRAVFSGSPIKRIGRDRFLRNVLIAIGNSAEPALAPVAEARVRDASALVRVAAIWALARLAPAARVDALRRRLAPGETDAAVSAEWRAAPGMRASKRVSPCP